MRRTLVLLAAAALCASTAHLAQRQADGIRHEVRLKLDMTWVPDGRVLKVASLGFEELVSDLLWMRAVLLFGQRWGSEDREAWGPWFVAMLMAIHDLDPTWKNPYVYGGMMLRVMGDADASDAVFKRAAEAIPDDPFFPFALGMNQYLLRNDAAGAATWIGRASHMPGAPPWYAAAAAGFLARKEQRATAIRFLEEERERTDNPMMRKLLQDKLDNIVHDEISARLEEARARVEARLGGPFRDFAALSAHLREIPQDPLGGVWIVAPDGVIRSSVREERERARALARERALLARP